MLALIAPARSQPLGRTVLPCVLVVSAALTACVSHSPDRVRVGLPAPRPMGYLDADGRPAGFIVESLTAAASRAGLAIEWAPAARCGEP